MNTDPKPWGELKAALYDAGLMLIDISRDSKYPEYRTKWSIQYLTELRNGRKGFGPDGPNIRVVHDIARVLSVHPTVLMPKREADVPQAIAS